MLADFIEETGAIAEDDGNTGDGIPDNVAEAAQAREFGADAVPVGVERDIVGGADDHESLSGEVDCAGVGHVELEGGAGGKWLRERDRGFVEAAGVVGVGVQSSDGKRDVLEIDTDAVPVERRRNLERDVGKRCFAVVAQGEEGADRDVLIGGVQVHVHVEISKGYGVAIGVFRGGCGDLLRAGWNRGASLGGGGPAFISGSGEDDFAGRLGWVLGGNGRLLRGRGVGGGLRH